MISQQVIKIISATTPTSFHKLWHKYLFELLWKLYLFRKYVKLPEHLLHAKRKWPAKIERNVWQWCASPPDLFNIHAEEILRKLYVVSEFIIGENSLNGIRYKIGIVLMADTEWQVQEKKKRRKREREKGLTIRYNKKRQSL